MSLQRIIIAVKMVHFEEHIILKKQFNVHIVSDTIFFSSRPANTLRSENISADNKKHSERYM